MIWQRVVRGAGVAALSLVLLSACGGGKDKKDSPTATQAPATTAPAPTTPATTAASPAATASPNGVGGQTTQATPADPASASPVASPAASPIAHNEAEAVSVILTDYRIAFFGSDFVAGHTYAIMIENNGSQPHQFAIEPVGAVNRPLTSSGGTASIATIAPGESATLIWTFVEPGIYQFACHMAGHYERGMVLNTIKVAS